MAGYYNNLTSASTTAGSSFYIYDGYYNGSTSGTAGTPYTCTPIPPSNVWTIYPQPVYQYQPVPPQIDSAEAIEMRKIAEEQLKAEQKGKRLAVETAERLLLETLGENRFKEYKATGRVSVDSPSKQGRKYQVDARNRIKVFEGDKLVDELCIHLVDSDQIRHDSNWLPEADVVLAKVFLLENDEERVLRVANHNLR